MFSEGDRVVLEPGLCCNTCSNCLSGKTNLCSSIRYIGSEGLDGSLCRFINHPVAFTHKLSDNVSLDEGTLAAMIANCIHSYWRADIKKNNKILIMGANLLGLMAIMVMKYLGVGSIFVTETSNHRLKLAKSFGADFAIKMSSIHSPEYPEYLKEIINSILSGEPDIIVDTVGTASSLECSFNLCKNGGRILLMKLMSRPIPARFIHATLREIDIIGAFSYTHSSFKEAIGLLKNEDLSFKKILPLKIPLERALDAFSHGRATIGENIFILVSSYSEKDKVRPVTSFPQTVETQTATIPEHKRHIEHKDKKSSRTEDNEIKESQDKMELKEKVAPLGDNQPGPIDSSIKKYESQIKQKEKEKGQNEQKMENIATKQNLNAQKIGTIDTKKDSEQKNDNIPTKKDLDKQKAENLVKIKDLNAQKAGESMVAKQDLSEQKNQNIAKEKYLNEQKSENIGTKYGNGKKAEIITTKEDIEKENQNIASKKGLTEQKIETVTAKKDVKEQKTENIATKKDLIDQKTENTKSTEISEGKTTEIVQTLEKVVEKKEDEKVSKQRDLKTENELEAKKLNKDEKQTVKKENTSYKVEQKESKSKTKKEEKINSGTDMKAKIEKPNHQKKTEELNDKGEGKKEK